MRGCAGLKIVQMYCFSSKYANIYTRKYKLQNRYYKKYKIFLQEKLNIFNGHFLRFRSYTITNKTPIKPRHNTDKVPMKYRSTTERPFT